jgi:hypothetical protein
MPALHSASATNSARRIMMLFGVSREHDCADAGLDVQRNDLLR